MLVDTFFIGLLDGDHSIARKIIKSGQDFFCHFPYTVFHKPRIFMRGKYHRTFVAAFEELVDTGAHGLLEDPYNFFKVNMLIVVSLDTEESPAPLIVGSHRYFGKKQVDSLLVDAQIFKDMVCPLFHDILCTGTCCHPRDFGTDAFADNRFSEGSFCNCACMYFNYFVAGRMAYRCLALYHELAAHKDLSTIGILVTIEQLTGYRAAKIFDLADFTVYCLLKNLINYLKIP